MQKKQSENKVSRRQALRLAGGAAAGVALSQTARAAQAAPWRPGGRRPNIVFILGDNHNAADMGCAGHPFIQTPGMDRLAREGVRFENTFNTTSLCSPSRASILTGAYCHNHGVRNNHTPWTGRMPTFLEHLSRSGYATAFIGKWHMPGKGLPHMPYLDLFVSYTYREGQGKYFNCPLVVNGKQEPSRKPYISEEMTDRTLDFIKDQQAAGKPFCVYLSHRPAHPPFDAPGTVKGMYDREELHMPRGADPYWFGKTNYNVYQGVMMGRYDDQYRKYCETITAMDRDIVRLLDELDARGLRDNTVVIYMADNGMQWGQHGCHGIREPYEDSIKLPFIVRAPGLARAPGSTRKHMALNIDVAPTLLDLAGTPVPPEMDGQSCVPVIADRHAPGREAFLLEFWRYYPENTPSYLGVRTQAHKYIEFERGRGPWLFDLERDPGENNNLFGTPRGHALLPDLQKMLEELSSGKRYDAQRAAAWPNLAGAGVTLAAAGAYAALYALIRRRHSISSKNDK